MSRRPPKLTPAVIAWTVVRWIAFLTILVVGFWLLEKVV